MIKNYLITVIVLLFVSCSVSKVKHWDKASFDNGVLKNIWAQSNQEPEDTNPNRYNTDYVQSKIKTSRVHYYKNVEEKNKNWIEPISKNNCQVSLPPSDTLSIRIGYYFTDGLEGGDGFFIHYKNKKFIIEPYQRRHRTIYEEKSRFKIIKQELKLNKENYCLGDSLYGWVYFHINETNKAWDGKVKIEHYASGYFRAIVKKICFGN